jgi:hypothetical protein
MPRRPSFQRRWLTAATWPVGIALTSWDYMWRSTPMHRGEELASASQPEHASPPFPDAVDAADVRGQQDGYGPLFHRRYRTRIRDADVQGEALMAIVKANPNKAAPTKFARFQKVLGEKGSMAAGDEYVVRMPGPWDGPVRVVAERPLSFRLATLAGHLEAGQIEFKLMPPRDGRPEFTFEIESWARSADWLSNLLYHHAKMSKEVQSHMWISFLEGVVKLSGGRMTGGVDLRTWRIEDGANDR